MSQRKQNADHRFTNRLIHETSPYLLQHAHNPVDWYAWGKEAFDAARAQNKPIFLSVGYSTCYWCHVMERQSFEVEKIAAEMNERYICIKVDREERPDVDQLYMTAVQVLTQHGGWPMSVFLLPDLRPFYGGTYFPPADMQGRPGFVTILRAVEDAFKNRIDDVNHSADELLQILRRVAAPTRLKNELTIDQEFIDGLIDRSVNDFDPVNGGFGRAPKFPRETLLQLLLYRTGGKIASTHRERLNRMLKHSLDAMAQGGIRDHLGGGFHRYSTDAQWLVPHFEIMLYDNALLAWCYVESYRQTGDKFHAEVAREIFDFILREMTSKDGAFFTAFDAEIDAKEGAGHVWTEEEVRRALTDEPGKGMGAPFSDADAELFAKVYGLDAGPNFADPHGASHLPDQNVLFLAEPALAARNGEVLERMRVWLRNYRQQRGVPMLDTKIITSWNALMIEAFAHGGKILNAPKYLDAAKRGAEFLLTAHRDEKGGLCRTSRDGAKRGPGFLDDYAYLVKALIALADSSGEGKWRETASGVAKVMREKFGDGGGAFFFSPGDADELIVRQKVASDSPLPSGNAIAASAMLELGEKDIARGIIEDFSGDLRQQAEGMSAMVLAALEFVEANRAIVAKPQAGGAVVESPTQLAQKIVGVGSRWEDAKTLVLILNIAESFHLYAKTTRVSVTGATVEFPKATQMRFAFEEAEQDVFAGVVEVVVRFDVPVQTSVKVMVEYLACDDNACLPTARREIEVAPRS